MPARSWTLLLLAVGLGFAVLYIPLESGPWRLVPALLFPVIPLLTLRGVAGRQAWAAILRPLSARDLGLALSVALFNIMVTFAIGAAVVSTFGASPNPAAAELSQQGDVDRVLFFAASIPQLLGEELLTMLPLLALLTWFHGRLGLSRRWALFWAWLLSAIPFALAHLPTYQWNLLQCLVVIGSARLVLTLAYLGSRNLLVSTLAHVINDWLLLGGALALAGLSSRAA